MTENDDRIKVYASDYAALLETESRFNELMAALSKLVQKYDEYSLKDPNVNA